MRATRWLLALLVPALALAALPAADDPTPDTGITWKKTVLDKAFRSEGVAVADVNKDGKLDILNGEVWYEAPDWKMHEIRPSKDYTKGKENVYSKSFACWTEDLNGDGWPDVIVIPFPGQPVHWFENPKGKPGHWKKHVIWHSACNETPQYVDLLGTGKRVLIMGSQPLRKLVEAPEGRFQLQTTENEGQLAYFTPGKDPTALWEMHPISEPGTPGKPMPGTFRFSHGLGVGDINGDGRLDVITTGGWWEQPSKPDGKTPWKFHPAAIGEACADMYAVDVDGDGKADVISSSAHGFGIWWHRQVVGKDGKSSFQTRPFFPKLVSQTHALVMADIDGDGVKDLVTGKRWWAHGPRGDADPNAPAMVYWFKGKKAKDGMMSYTPHVIDSDSGIGTQFTVTDVNGDGLLDVVVSNKKGTYLFEQVRSKK
jgi:hypothetical protein